MCPPQISLPHLPLKSPYKNWLIQHEKIQLLMYIMHLTLYKFMTIFLWLSILNVFLAILEAQVFKIFWRRIPPIPPRKLAPAALGCPPIYNLLRGPCESLPYSFQKVLGSFLALFTTDTVSGPRWIGKMNAPSNGLLALSTNVLGSKWIGEDSTTSNGLLALFTVVL